MTGVRSSSR